MSRRFREISREMDLAERFAIAVADRCEGLECGAVMEAGAFGSGVDLRLRSLIRKRKPDAVKVEGLARNISVGAHAGRRVADPVIIGVRAATEESEACVERGERRLQLDGLFVLWQMKSAKEFEFFELDLLRWEERGADGEGGVDITRAREDDVTLHAVVFEPWVGR